MLSFVGLVQLENFVSIYNDV